MPKYRRIPTISGNEPKDDPFFAAEFAPDDAANVLDLHGLTVAEAKHALDLFLDRAVATGSAVVKVIHGKGTGALAAFLAEALPGDPRVADTRPSHRPGESAVLARLYR